MLHLTAAAQSRLSDPSERIAVLLLEQAGSETGARSAAERESFGRAAAAMLEIAREDDVLGHVGHGQLALLLADRSSAEDAIEIAERLRTSLGKAPSSSASWPVVELNLADRTQPAYEVLRKHGPSRRDRRWPRGLLAGSEEQSLQLTAEELLEEVHGVGQALRNRATVDRAVGVVMERLGCEANEAFALLSEVSQGSNRKLHLVAGDLTGDASAHSTGGESTGTPLRLVTLALCGEIDMANADELRKKLASVADQDAAVVVLDFAQVTFIDCAGLNPLLEARARMGRRLRLRNVPPQVRRLLVFSGTADALLH